MRRAMRCGVPLLRAAAALPAAARDRRGGGAAKGGGAIEVFVACGGQTVAVELPAAAGVAALRGAAAAALSLPPNAPLRLRWQGAALADDGATLADIGIGPEARLDADAISVGFAAASPNCTLLDDGKEVKVGWTEERAESGRFGGAGYCTVAGAMPPNSGRYEARFRYLVGSACYGAFGAAAAAPGEDGPALEDGMPGLDVPRSWAFVPCHPDRCRNTGDGGEWIGRGGIPPVHVCDDGVESVVISLRLDTDRGVLSVGMGGEWYDGEESDMQVPAEPLWFVFGDTSGEWCGVRLLDASDDAE